MAKKITTKTFENMFKKYPSRSQDVPNPIVVTKLFDIAGSANWYLTEYDPESKVAFGYVAGLCPGCDEWGSIYIPELEEIKHMGIPRIERDIHWRKQNFSELGLK